MPTISVILPAYNAAHTVARAIRSILDQTLDDLELIVVDDGSTDETVEVVSQFDDPRLQLIQTAHAGVAEAANRATTHARAQWIARMDADDYAYPQRLGLQLRQLAEQQFDVIGSRVRILDESGAASMTLARYERWINEETMTGADILALRFVELPLVNPTILADRRYFELGCLTGDLPEDYDLMLRAAAAGMQFGKVDQVLLDWTDHPGRLTRGNARYSQAAFARCRRQHLIAGPLRSTTHVDLWGLGQTGKDWLRWLQTQGLVVRHAYEVSDRKVDQKIHGVPVSHSSKLAVADGTPLLIAVGAEGARALIRPQVLARGYVPGRDAWFVA